MPRENRLTTIAARLARLPFWLLVRRSVVPPEKALILKPCCLSQVMLATPLLSALSTAYPQARLDWAVSEWAWPALAGNPRVTEAIITGEGGLHGRSWREIGELVQRLRQERYDTCFIPSRSGLLSYIAWRARIPQRIGLHIDGRGFAHTAAIKPPPEAQHATAVYLSLLAPLGVDMEDAPMEFYPSDPERTSATERLVELDWLGDKPLVIVHPGGGENPVEYNRQKRWPVERFVLLCNHLVRQRGAQVVLVGAERDRPLAKAIIGMMPVPAANLAGRITLGELGAMCEVADLYVGNDAGPTHVSAAVGCPTLAIFGPSDPAVSAPYATKGKVVTLWHPPDGPDDPFSWRNGVSVDEAIEAADRLL